MSRSPTQQQQQQRREAGAAAAVSSSQQQQQQQQRRSVPNTTTVFDGEGSGSDEMFLHDVTIDELFPDLFTTSDRSSRNINRNDDGMSGGSGTVNAPSSQSQEVLSSSNSSTTKSCWMILVVSLSICFVAIMVLTAADHKAYNSNNANFNSSSNNNYGKTSKIGVTWSITIIILSLVISWGVTICYLFPNASSCSKIFVSTKGGKLLELISSGVLLVLWCVGLSLIMDPGNSIAVGYTQIVNGNLYVCSWISFVCIIYIFGDLLNALYGQTTSIHSTADMNTGEYIQLQTKRLWDTRRGKWCALFTISGIVVSSCVRTYQAFDCYLTVMTATHTCQDTTVGIAMSVVGGVIAVVISCVNGCITNTKNANVIETMGAVVSTIVWTIAWGFITFGEGPGHSLGNLYFSTWGAFVISILITRDCVQEYMANRTTIVSSTTSTNTHTTNTTDIQSSVSDLEMIEQEQQQQQQQQQGRHQVEVPSADADADADVDNNNNEML